MTRLTRLRTSFAFQKLVSVCSVGECARVLTLGTVYGTVYRILSIILIYQCNLYLLVVLDRVLFHVFMSCNVYSDIISPDALYFISFVNILTRSKLGIKI